MPAESAPDVSGEVAYCAVCKTQWQVHAPTDKLACRFCGAGKLAITVLQEEE